MEKMIYRESWLLVICSVRSLGEKMIFFWLQHFQMFIHEGLLGYYGEIEVIPVQIDCCTLISDYPFSDLLLSIFLCFPRHKTIFNILKMYISSHSIFNFLDGPGSNIPHMLRCCINAGYLENFISLYYKNEKAKSSYLKLKS